MKKLFSIIAVGLVVAVGIAYAVPSVRNEIRHDFRGGITIGGGAVSMTAANKISESLGGSATIDFASTTVGVVESSAITVTGAAANDVCIVGPPIAAGELKARFECYVSAADAVKVKFTPLAEDQGTITLSGGSGTATVTSGATCVCTDTTANASVQCAVSGTTLTATGTTTDVISYYCRAAVNPASGTFKVRTFAP